MARLDSMLEPLLAGAHPIKSPRRLRDLLGISVGELARVAEDVGAYYKTFEKRKKVGGKVRTIHNPQGQLRFIQDGIKSAVFSRLGFPPGMMGGIRGRSTKTNAALHVNQPAVVTMDLRDCFPHTTCRKVYDVFVDRLGCIPDVARLLTRITTVDGHVPQGAPTSSGLVNLALLEIYYPLERLAQDLDLNFSIYVDDITFSGYEARSVFEPAVRAIRQAGYKVHAGKVHVLSRSRLQEVTGNAVNSKSPTISRARRDAIAGRIFELAAAGACSEKDHASVWGRINQVAWVCPGQARHLAKLATDLLSPPSS